VFAVRLGYLGGGGGRLSQVRARAVMKAMLLRAIGFASGRQSNSILEFNRGIQSKIQLFQHPRIQLRDRWPNKLDIGINAAPRPLFISMPQRNFIELPRLVGLPALCAVARGCRLLVLSNLSSRRKGVGFSTRNLRFLQLVILD
jgi:hypothetical protein